MGFSASTPPFGSQFQRKSFSPQKDQQKGLDPKQVLQATDIVSLIGEVVALRPRSGKDEFIGLCPFHSDSHPSFEVNGTKQIYSCWSCSAGLNLSRGGDAITFVRRYFSLGYRDALEFLAKRAGMPIPDQTRPGPSISANPTFVPRPAAQPQPPRDGAPNLNAPKQPLFDALRKAQEVFSEELTKSSQATEYLFKERGLTPALLSRYLLGYAPASFGTLRKHFPDYDSTDVLIDAGLARLSAKKTKYDFFRDRITFGVRDESGKIVAFGGRRLSDVETVDKDGKPVHTPKYMNSAETAIFSKKEVLFGWYEAKPYAVQAGYTLIVEGYMDVLGLANQGVNNATACMGTALTESHIQTILQATKKAVFCLDGDLAGQKGAFRSLSGLFPHLDNDVEVRFLSLPNDMDPDEYVRAHGKAAFLKQVDDASTLPQFWERALTSLFSLDKKEDREQLWRSARDLVDLLPADSQHRAILGQIAARLSGRNTPKKTAAPTARAGLSTFLVNEPSDRLFLAVMRMPYVAAGVRPALIDLQRTVAPDLLPTLGAWQAKYDQAMAAGMATAGNPQSDAEIRQYTSVIEAAPSILSQYLAAVTRKQTEKALQDGILDETSYLNKVTRSCFAKPA